MKKNIISIVSFLVVLIIVAFAAPRIIEHYTKRPPAPFPEEKVPDGEKEKVEVAIKRLMDEGYTREEVMAIYTEAELAKLGTKGSLHVVKMLSAVDLSGNTNAMSRKGSEIGRMHVHMAYFHDEESDRYYAAVCLEWDTELVGGEEHAFGLLFKDIMYKELVSCRYRYNVVGKKEGKPFEEERSLSVTSYAEEARRVVARVAPVKDGDASLGADKSETDRHRFFLMVELGRPSKEEITLTPYYYHFGWTDNVENNLLPRETIIR